MTDRYGTIRIAIEGEKAKKMYDIIANSRICKEFPDSLKLEYKENLLFIEAGRSIPVFSPKPKA